MTVVTCPACDAPLQPLDASNSYAKRASAALEDAGIHVGGPALLWPVGPLVAHWQTVHPQLPLRKYLNAARIGRF
jgi:hypothetical protein